MRRETPTPTVTEVAYPHRVDSPESTAVRNPRGEPTVRSAAHSPIADHRSESATPRDERWLVTTPDEREALTFSEAATGDDGGDAAMAFVTDTDLSEETLLVHQYDVGECETRRVDRLEWSTEVECGDRECVGIELWYTPVVRESDGCRDTEIEGPPYDEGSHHTETTFVRIPARVESLGAFGYGYGFAH